MDQADFLAPSKILAHIARLSLRWGNTQYNEVPAEYASLLVENYTNKLLYLGNQDLEFLKWPLAVTPLPSSIIIP